MIKFPVAICGGRRVAKNSIRVSCDICLVDANQLWEASWITYSSINFNFSVSQRH